MTDNKILTRYQRTLRNLRHAIQMLPTAAVLDNSDLRELYRLLAGYEEGKLVERGGAWPKWFSDVAE